MESFDQKEACPKCHSLKMKAWHELNEEEQFLAERLPASAHFKVRERKKHRFCTRCWFEEIDAGDERV